MNKAQQPLYNEQFEHDACGIGAVVSIDGIQSYKVLDDALKIVEKLEHRAGKDATGEVGDGVGILTQISHSFFKKVAAAEGIQLGDARTYGIGMFFFPQDTLKRNFAMKMFEKKVCSILDGVKSLFVLKFLANVPVTACHISCNASLKSLQIVLKVLILTASFTSHDVNLNRVMMIHMSYPSLPERLSTKVCF